MKSGGISGKPLVGQDRADDERRDAVAGFLQAFDGLAQLLQIGLGQRTARSGLRRSGDIALGKRYRAHIGGLFALRCRSVSFADQLAVAVIGRIGADDPTLTGREAGHAQSATSTASVPLQLNTTLWISSP